MRYQYSRAALVLLALGACSGGDSLTTPTGDATATLTVAGAGAGSAHVASAPGVDPVVSCDLAGAAATGTCSATYPIGTVVQLTITPGTGATFTGWTGDAASCGTATSCSVTMSTNQTVTAGLSSGTVSSTEVQVVSSDFYPDPSFGGTGAVIWVVEVRNPTSRMVDLAEIEITTHDVSGAVLATSSTFVGPIPPGQSRVSQDLADYTGNEATASFRVADVQTGSGVDNLGGAEIVSSDWQADATGKVVNWSVQVRNTTSTELQDVAIEFSTYDATGKVVAGDMAFVGPIAPGETQSGESIAQYHGTEATAKFQVARIE
ncbi:MAG: FxLYD domain-containing protein [Gemmatimonadales bacterium]